MNDHLPSVSQANTDGDGLLKRTRRPALSCVECRMRKVKCNRQKPCEACIKTKSKTCTYRKARNGIHGSVRSNSAPSKPDAPEIAGKPQRPRPKPLIASTIGSTTPADNRQLSFLASLLKEDDGLRTALGHGAAPEDDTRPIVDIITDIPGTFQKSKFFGQSHWMKALEPVGGPISLLSSL